MAHRLAYAPTFDEIFAEIDILFPDATEAGLIASEPDPCPIHRQPVTRCPDSCEYHA